MDAMAGLSQKGAPSSFCGFHGSSLISLGSFPVGFLHCNGLRPMLVIRCSGKDPASSQASAPASPITQQHSLAEIASKPADLGDNLSCIPDETPPSEQRRIGSDIKTILRRFWKVAAPYWSSKDKFQGRVRLGVVFALTLATTGISVGFNFLGRDFYNALASKDQEQFTKQLLYYLGAFIGGIPIFVLRDYARDTLALRWRAWMTSYYLDRYFKNRTFYDIQSQSLLDNPDQRIVDDLSSFTGTALSFSLALFNATIDLISFSGILYGIYPPLFYVLIVYSIGGTAISVALGKDLVNLNFLQEKKEADFRFGLVRIRENAESIAFYGGEGNEIQLLLDRFKRSFENYSGLLVASRNLEFFQSGYRYVIQVLPAAVVAPMYFSGKIEFGVINQSYSAFNHILSDFSLIVYQFQALSAFSAVIDRLGEFNDILESRNAIAQEKSAAQTPLIQLVDRVVACSFPRNDQSSDVKLLQIEKLTLQTPQYTMSLIEDLTLTVCRGENLLVMGVSGSGKTSLLRAIAGLWRSGKGTISRFILSPIEDNNGAAFQDYNNNLDKSNQTVTETTEDSCEPSNRKGSILFLPQRPYMVLGTLRQQLLYPTWSNPGETDQMSGERDLWFSSAALNNDNFVIEEMPSDDQLRKALLEVNLGNLLERCDGLDSQVEWASVLSLGEQQRLGFARVLLTQPVLALLDESTSALDEENEAALYRIVRAAGVTYVSVGHRSSLQKFHSLRLTIADCKVDDLGRNWKLEHLIQ